MSIFFKSGLLEKDFYEYLHIIVAERAHKMFFNHELGTESENNLRSGHVTWGHRYLKFCVKCSLKSISSWPLTFFMYVDTKEYQEYHNNTGNMKY